MGMRQWMNRVCNMLPEAANRSFERLNRLFER